MFVRRGLRTALVLTMLAAVGCGGATTRPLVAGPYTLRSEPELFERVVEAARSHGYEVSESDPVRGRFAVRAHTSGPRNLPAAFVVQCYRPGWIEVTAAASFIRMEHGAMRMPGSLYEEYRDFALALMRELEGGS